MEPGDHDPPDARTTRSSRRDSSQTERLREDSPVYGDPVNPNWRGERASGRSRRAQTMPSSRQEFLLWLQYGGWRILAAAAVVAALAIALIIVTRTPPKSLPVTRSDSSSAALTNPPIIPEQQATVTPPPITPTATLPPQQADGAKFKVVNTGSEGLFLRPDHSTGGQPLMTLPDNTIVTIVGEDFVGPDRVWKHVRAPDGTEGWAASDFLQPAQ